MFHALYSILEFFNDHLLLLNTTPLPVFIPPAKNSIHYNSMKKYIHALMKFMISMVFSLIAWVVVDCLILQVNFMQYFLIEVVIILSQFAYDWQLKHLNHEKEIVK